MEHAAVRRPSGVRELGKFPAKFPGRLESHLFLSAIAMYLNQLCTKTGNSLLIPWSLEATPLSCRYPEVFKSVTYENWKFPANSLL
jgi:hypothetical protein